VLLNTGVLLHNVHVTVSDGSLLHQMYPLIVRVCLSTRLTALIHSHGSNVWKCTDKSCQPRRMQDTK